MRTTRRSWRDERGISLLYVTTGFLSFFAATALAVDVGMLVTARSQAQNAADGGALAGAIALAIDDYDNRTATGPAVSAAIDVALDNAVVGQEVSVEPADVTFPAAPDGEFNRVRVLVSRTEGRDNPLSTFIMAVFGMDTANMSAMATAEAAPANAMTCVRPFTIPDRWIENSAPPWNSNSTFDLYDNQGNPLPNADVYIPVGQPGYNGYNGIADKGTPLMIRAGTGNNVATSFYWSWKMPGEIGADFYEENISGCNQSVAHLGDLMTPEPGNMSGPTMAGIDDLIAQDPNAYWDDVSNSVKSPLGRSPRIFPIPLYDPEYYTVGKQNGRNADLRMANWLGFFVERRQGNNVFGRITPILGTIDPDAGPSPDGVFPRAVRLVE